jgi:hypothetical protein
MLTEQYEKFTEFLQDVIYRDRFLVLDQQKLIDAKVAGTDVAKPANEI